MSPDKGCRGSVSKLKERKGTFVQSDLGTQPMKDLRQDRLGVTMQNSDTADVSVALQMVLMLENVECRAKANQ